MSQYNGKWTKQELEEWAEENFIDNELLQKIILGLTNQSASLEVLELAEDGEESKRGELIIRIDLIEH